MLSRATNELLVRLKAWPVSGWSLCHKRELCALIKALGASAEMLACPQLLRFAWHADRDIAREAAGAIGALLADVTALDLAFLDLFMRAASPYHADSINALNVQRMGMAHDACEPVVGLASFHHDGYVREAATRALAASSSGAEIPFLLIRANDWIHPVRHIAVQALMARTDAKYAALLMRSLPLVVRLRALGRGDHQELAQALENTVASEPAASALRAGIDSADHATRRECAKLAVAFRKVSICLYALNSTDNMVRIHCARFLLAALPVDEVCSLASDLAFDTCAVVRREALLCVVKQCPRDREARLRKALLDSNASVRGLAVYKVRATLDLDVASIYRTHLTGVSDRQVAASIVGLGECGTVDDVPLLRSILGTASLRIRRSVLHAIAILDAQGNADLFSMALVSASPGVSRKACEILLKNSSLADDAALETAMLASSHGHVRKNAFKVLARTRKWPSLRFILLAVQADDETLQDLPSNALRRWLRDYNRRFTQAQAAELRCLKSLLGRLKAKLPAQQYATLNAILTLH
jgi:HEAT repeat protein